jgi:hypothetical protein
LVVDLLGSPTEDEINNIPRVRVRDYLRKLGKRHPKDLALIFKNASELGKK